MSSGIVEDEDMILIRIICLQDIYCCLSLPQNALIREITLSSFSSLEEHLHILIPIRGVVLVGLK